MATPEGQEGGTTSGRPGIRRWLPLAGIPAAAALAHLGGGALLHLGLGAALASLGLGAVLARFGTSAAVGVASAVVMLALAIAGARHGRRHR